MRPTTSLELAAVALFAMLAIAPIGANAADPKTYEVKLTDSAFEPAELKVPAGEDFFINFQNDSNATAEVELKEMRFEKIVKPGSAAKVRVRAAKPGKYLFVNEFKEDSVKGHVVVE